jgi:hypothetical protein
MYACIIKNDSDLKNWEVRGDSSHKTKYKDSGSALGFFKEIKTYLKGISPNQIEQPDNFKEKILQTCNQVKKRYESSWKARIINKIKNICSAIFHIKIVNEKEEIERIHAKIIKTLGEIFAKNNPLVSEEILPANTKIERPKNSREIKNIQMVQYGLEITPVILNDSISAEYPIQEPQYPTSKIISKDLALIDRTIKITKDQSAVNHFATVPNDILNVIFSDFSSPQDYFNFRAVCKKFHETITKFFLRNIKINLDPKLRKSFTPFEMYRNRFILNNKNQIKNFFSSPSEELNISEFVDKFMNLFPLNSEFKKLITTKNSSYKKILNAFLETRNPNPRRKINLEQAIFFLKYFEPCPTVEHLIYKIANLMNFGMFIGEVDSNDLAEKISSRKLKNNTFFLRCSPNKGVFVFSHISAIEEKQKEDNQNNFSIELDHFVIIHDKKKDDFTIEFKERDFSAPTLPKLMIEMIKEMPELLNFSNFLYPSSFNDITSSLHMKKVREWVVKDYNTHAFIKT